MLPLQRSGRTRSPWNHHRVQAPPTCEDHRCASVPLSGADTCQDAAGQGRCSGPPADRTPLAPRHLRRCRAAPDGSGGNHSLVPLPSLSATTTQVASGLKRPTALVAPDDGTGRLFITEKSGTVRVYRPDTGLAATPIVDIKSAVDESGNERGLLGIAVPPDFADSQDLYLAYTALPDGAVTLARYRLDESRLKVLLSQEHASTATTTAASSPSARTAICTGASATAAAPGPLRAGAAGGHPAGQDHAYRREPELRGPRVLRSRRQSVRRRPREPARRSGPTGCATRGGSPSTRRRLAVDR